MAAPRKAGFRIVDLHSLGADGRQQAAEVLAAAFKEHSLAWPTPQLALEEVDEFNAEGRLCRAAVDESGRLLGWIGGIEVYAGHAWELHPLAVHPQFQGRGIGTQLVLDLEELVRARGAVTMFLGSDDETGQTSLGGADLYPDVLSNLASIRDLKRHAYGFYLKLGYVIVGAIPDANGFGKPDILMAKRIQKA